MPRVPSYIYSSTRFSILRELDTSGGTCYFSVVVENPRVFTSVVIIIIHGSFYFVLMPARTLSQHMMILPNSSNESFWVLPVYGILFFFEVERSHWKKNQLGTLSTLESLWTCLVATFPFHLMLSLGAEGFYLIVYFLQANHTVAWRSLLSWCLIYLHWSNVWSALYLPILVKSSQVYFIQFMIQAQFSPFLSQFVPSKLMVHHLAI